MKHAIAVIGILVALFLQQGASRAQQTASAPAASSPVRAAAGSQAPQAGKPEVRMQTQVENNEASTEPCTEPSVPERQLSKWEGVRGIVWGEQLAEITGVQKKEEEGCYVRPSDRLCLGSIRLDSIHYYFHRDMLYKCVFATTDYDATLAALKIAYGKGHKKDEVTSWHNGLKPATVGMTLRKTKWNNGGTLEVTFLSLQALKTADDKAENVLQAEVNANKIANQ